MMITVTGRGEMSIQQFTDTLMLQHLLGSVRLSYDNYTIHGIRMKKTCVVLTHKTPKVRITFTVGYDAKVKVEFISVGEE
jgi:hypothetical protein